MDGEPRGRQDASPGGPDAAPKASDFHFRFEGVTKWFDSGKRAKDRICAVENVSFGVRHGEVVSLIGPSGCGKSTLLSIAAGLSKPSGGRALLDEAEILAPRPEIAFMLQKDLLLPWRTVQANIEFGIEIQRYPKAERRQRAGALLAQCKLTNFESYYPHQISGGMRQRTALARTLAVDPEMLLLDEPFSALDAQTKMVLRRDLARILQTHHRTTLLITHDITEALSLSDRVVVMSHRPGTVLREITVDLPHRDDPLKRSLDPNIGHYVAEIWDLLKIEE